MIPRRFLRVMPIAAILLGPLPAVAEVAANPSLNGAFALSVTSLSTGGQDADPWPTVRDHIPASWVLNATGSQNVPPDGFPTFGFDPIGQTYEVIWARHDGSDFELVFSRWEGQGWSTPVPLTEDAVDDLGPVLAYAPDGSARLSFVRPDGVYAMRRPPGGSWSAPERVDAGAFPSVAATPTDRVAYQRPAGGAGVEVVAAERSTSWQPEVLSATTFAGFDGTGDVDVRLHASGTIVWIDWEQDGGGLGWSRLDASGQWTPAAYEPVAGPADEEAGRLRIARQVLR